MRALTFLCAVLFVPAAIAAPRKKREAPVTMAKLTPSLRPVERVELSDVPAKNAVDADLEQIVADAEKLARDGRREEAGDKLIRLTVRWDRFTLAQAPSLQARSAKLLGAWAKADFTDGKVASAARLADASWALGGRKPDPEGAKIVLAYAEDNSLEQAAKLYVARRALQMDAANADAIVLDKRYSTNPMSVPATAVMGVGAASGFVGLLSWMATSGITSTLQKEPHTRAEVDSLVVQRNVFGLTAATTIIGGAVLMGAGYWLLNKNEPPDEPVSPPNLPAFEEVQ